MSLVETGAARTPRLVIAVLAVAVLASPVLLAPYLTLDPDHSRIDVEGLHFAVLVLHVTTASTAIVLGGLQLVPRIRARRHVHRRIGRTFLVLGLLAFGLTAVPLAITTPSGTLTRYGTLVPAVGFLVCAALGWTAARERRFEDHRDWMIRTFALAFFALTTRLLVPLMLAVQAPWIGSLYDGDVQRAVEASIPVGQWLGWVLDLAIAEFVIRRRLRPAVV
jgi:hypothetical protein